MTAEGTSELGFVTPQAFVSTYNPPSEASPWQLVQEYQEVMDFHAEHPQRGSSWIASRLDIPRSRLRSWVRDENPGCPDCVRGLQIAEEHGWIEMGPESEIFRGMNILMASVFSGGSISASSFWPTFSVDNGEDIDRLAASLSRVGVDYDVKRIGDRSPTEVTPTDNGSILGRVLVSLGAPRGRKSKVEVSLPEYLDRVGHHHRQAFARTYLLNRGIRTNGSNSLTFREERDKSYLEELRRFLAQVSGGKVRRNGKNIIVSGNAVHSLRIN